MIPKECKRLIEVDFPIAEVSKQSAREKSIRHGHPSTLHLWWARRPLAACRSVLLGLIFPDPCDPNCPEEFKSKARKALSGLPVAIGKDDVGLRQSLLDFIATFSDWDRSSESIWLEASRKLVKAAYPEETPLVVDPFAGGGSIPLEALRVGCDAFASDLNPVAGLILKTLLEDIPKYGSELAKELREACKELIVRAEKELQKFYPIEPDGNVPIAYLWARTINCESPNCGAEIPLMRSFWLSKKKGKLAALKYEIDNKGSIPKVVFKIFEPPKISDVHGPTVNRANATCLVCGNVTPDDRVRRQITNQNGGADVLFDENRNRIGGSRLICKVVMDNTTNQREYFLIRNEDYFPIYRAQKELLKIETDLIPNEHTPWKNSHRSVVSPRIYGMLRWKNLFNARQKLTLGLLVKQIRELDPKINSVKNMIALSLYKSERHWNCHSKWHNKSLTVAGAFGLNALPMTWDFPESYPFNRYAGGLNESQYKPAEIVEKLVNVIIGNGQVQLEDAIDSPLPDESCSIWFTDPPYWDNIAYADLSDFFFVWLKKMVDFGELFGQDKAFQDDGLTQKSGELTVTTSVDQNSPPKDGNFFIEGMEAAFFEGDRILQKNGVGCVVFAHKTTEGWESLLTGMLNGGWHITASWPITTERSSRLVARETAALATSVHIVCRPRPKNAPFGEWEDILRQLPKRMRKWVIRLDNKGIHGADLVFSCIGPALELFSKYRKVETAEGEEVKLGPNVDANGEAAKRGYLSYIWEVVGRTALELVLSGDGDEGIGTLEEDARLCALFLWTHQSTETQNDKKINGDVPKMSGLSLPFDIVRRFAQPLGIHLPDWEDRVIKTEKGVVKLIPVVKRAKQLFGVDITSAANQFELQAQEDPQMELSLALETAEAPEIGRRRRGGTISGDKFEKASTATTLDRIHAAILLQAGGKTNALRALLKQEVERGPEFLRLANSLSALYPQGIEEKRLLDAMLLTVPK